MATRQAGRFCSGPLHRFVALSYTGSDVACGVVTAVLADICPCTVCGHRVATMTYRHRAENARRIRRRGGWESADFSTGINVLERTVSRIRDVVYGHKSAAAIMVQGNWTTRCAISGRRWIESRAER